MKINIEKKPKSNCNEEITISKSEDVYNLEIVKEIKEAVQEHFLFIGLNNRNKIINVNLLGIGSSTRINIDGKDILRNALVNACDKVILIHNHPSNSLEPSKYDIELTKCLCNFFDIFNIKLLDHIIVTGKSYVSIVSQKYINNELEDKRISMLNKTLLIEENIKLKEKIKQLENKTNKNIECER